MKTASAWFAEYGQSHQNPVNKRIHWVCIPLILVVTLGLFQSIPLPFEAPAWLHGGTLLVLASLVFYFRLSWTLGLGMTLVSMVALGINQAIVSAGLPLLGISVGVFVVAWVFQFIGHRIEGKKPSFFKDVQFLLIGPAWLVHHIYARLGIAVQTGGQPAPIEPPLSGDAPT